MFLDEWFDQAVVDDHGAVVLHRQHAPHEEGALRRGREERRKGGREKEGVRGGGGGGKYKTDD